MNAPQNTSEQHWHPTDTAYAMCQIHEASLGFAEEVHFDAVIALLVILSSANRVCDGHVYLQQNVW